MIFYILFFVISILLYYLMKANIYRKNTKTYCIIMGIFLFLLFAFRDASMGMSDVYNSYVPTFYRMKYYSMNELMSGVSDSYLFYIITKIISQFTNNVHIWIALMSAPICLAVMRLIKTYSKIPWLSLIIYFSLGYLCINFTLMKQSLAMAFVIFELLQLHKKKYIKSIIYWIIAVGFHSSALIAIIPILLNKFGIKITIKKSIIISMFSLLIWFTSDVFIRIIFNTIKFASLQKYLTHLSKFNITMFMVFLIMFIFCIIIKEVYIDGNNKIMKSQETMDNNINYLILVYSLCLPFLALTSSFADIYRISIYFSIVIIVLLPNIIASINDILVRYSSFVIVILVLLYYGEVRGLMPIIPYLPFFN